MEPDTPIELRIPDDLDFADLKLARDPATGDLSFDWSPLEKICEASGIDPALLDDPDEDYVSELIIEWYAAHLARGGAPDFVQEALIAEAAQEDSP
jgi:hypothetical protein